MSWQTPKTNWTIQPLDENGRYNGDWFNVSDYSRIVGNIETIKDIANGLYLNFQIVSILFSILLTIEA